jgi:hypothetical protein
VASDRDPELADYALYYLGLAERDLNHDAGAVSVMHRLAADYPQSVLAQRAEVVAAQIELKSGHNTEAESIASRVVSTEDHQVEQDARLILARALAARGDPGRAYEQIQTLRNKYPNSDRDAGARARQRSLLTQHPEIVPTAVDYRREEAELLLREGQAFDALAQVSEAIKLSPPPTIVAELRWI